MSFALAHDPRFVLPKDPIFPKYSAGERMADAVVHIISVTISLVAVITLMIVAWPLAEPLSIISLWVYGAGMVAVFAFSAGYHLVRRPTLKEALRRLDHAAIFVMIAGSCTPFALVNIGGAYGIALLSVVWGIGLLGIALKLFLPRRFERVSIGLYLVQGWAVLAAVQPLASGVSPLVLALLACIPWVSPFIFATGFRITTRFGTRWCWWPPAATTWRSSMPSPCRFRDPAATNVLTTDKAGNAPRIPPP
jgi:hemolysin III